MFKHMVEDALVLDRVYRALGDSTRRGLLATLRQRRALEPAFRHLPLLTADEVATGRPVPFYRDWVTHEPGDDFWRELAFAPILALVRALNLTVQPAGRSAYESYGPAFIEGF